MRCVPSSRGVLRCFCRDRLFFLRPHLSRLYFARFCSVLSGPYSSCLYIVFYISKAQTFRSFIAQHASSAIVCLNITLNHLSQGTASPVVTVSPAGKHSLCFNCVVHSCCAVWPCRYTYSLVGTFVMVLGDAVSTLRRTLIQVRRFPLLTSASVEVVQRPAVLHVS